MPARSRTFRRARSRPAPPAPGEPTEAQIARIDALTATGRTNWFALLAYLAFVLVTTLGVEDVDFFVDSRQTELPLVGVSIPTFSFFVFAPVLGAALYAYLHLHVRKVSEALVEPPPGDPPLEERIRPWLLNDTILRRRDRLRAEPGATIRPRPLDRLATLTTLLLVWWSGPLVLAIMWGRTWPAHALGLSALCALCLMAAVYTGVLSWTKMRAETGGGTHRVAVWTGAVAFACLPVAWLTAANSKGIGEVMIPDWFATPFTFRQQVTSDWAVGVRGIDRRLPDEIPVWREVAVAWTWDTLTGLFHLDPPDLTAARLSALPPEHADLDAARHRYRTEWCERNGLGPDTCGGAHSASDEAHAALWRMREEWCRPRGFPVPDGCRAHFAALEQEFAREWPAYRNSIIAGLAKPVLEARDLRRAEASGAHLVGVDLRFAQMQRAKLIGAQLEGAILIGARMEGANLSEARMEGADLRGAWMEGAYLFEARLGGANLSDARMEGAYLTYARMEGADLYAARLEGAYLSSARMEGANLSEARLEGADLRTARMEGADLYAARLEGADLSSARMEGASLRRAQLEGANVRRAQMEGADLLGAQMGGVDLRGAQMEGADLSFSKLMGMADHVIVLQDTVLDAAVNNGGALRFVDLSPAISNPASDFRNSFGDASVVLPDFIGEDDRPCQWARGDPLPDEAFYARWRGWIELFPGGGENIWRSNAPEGWHDVQPVPPPPGCTWHD